MDAEAVLAATPDQFTQKNHLVIELPHRNIVVFNPFKGFLHFVEFMIMGGKKCFSPGRGMFMNIFNDRPRNRDTVISAGAPSKFIEQDQRPRRKVVDYARVNFSSAGEVGDPVFQAKIREKPENYAFTFDIDVLPKPFPAPTLIVTGRQDSMVGYRDAWEILDNYPRGTFAVLDRSGHFLGIEQEDLFHALASEWLDRVEEYAQDNG